MSATVTLAGRLTGDPELRFTPAGAAMARFTVVTSRRRKNDAGEWEDTDTTFWPCTAWRQLAEETAEQLRKGDAVIVRGDARQHSWETKDGEKRSRIEVRVDSAGPDLRWPRKGSQRSTSSDDADPWASSPQDAGGSDEPPF